MSHQRDLETKVEEFRDHELLRVVSKDHRHYLIPFPVETLEELLTGLKEMM